MASEVAASPRSADVPVTGNLTAAASSMAAGIPRWHPAGMRGRWGMLSGGVASLNPRLQAGYPPGMLAGIGWVGFDRSRKLHGRGWHPLRPSSRWWKNPPKRSWTPGPSSRTAPWPFSTIPSPCPPSWSRPTPTSTAPSSSLLKTSRGRAGRGCAGGRGAARAAMPKCIAKEAQRRPTEARAGRPEGCGALFPSGFVGRRRTDRHGVCPCHPPAPPGKSHATRLTRRFQQAARAATAKTPSPPTAPASNSSSPSSNTSPPRWFQLRSRRDAPEGRREGSQGCMVLHATPGQRVKITSRTPDGVRGIDGGVRSPRPCRGAMVFGGCGPGVSRLGGNPWLPSGHPAGMPCEAPFVHLAGMPFGDATPDKRRPGGAAGR